MQYKYCYTTRKMIGHVNFEDLFEAIQYMNKHAEEAVLVGAEIWDILDNKVVCSKRTIQ
jgi:hypothetical protein